jgi:hypothetical protein
MGNRHRATAGMAQEYRNADRTVAKCPEVQKHLAKVAQDMAARARAIAHQHDRSGDFAASITTDHGRIDHYVIATDDDAVSKEFGRTGATGHGTSQGVFALTRALAGEGGR